MGKLKVGNAGRTVALETETHKITFNDCGPGIAVMIPEWDRMALVLERGEVEKVYELFGSYLGRAR